MSNASAGESSIRSTRLVAGAEEEEIAPDSTGEVEVDAFIPRLTVPASHFSPSTNHARHKSPDVSRVDGGTVACREP